MAAKKRLRGSPKVTSKLVSAAVSGALKPKRKRPRRGGTTVTPAGAGQRRRAEEQAKIGGGLLGRAASAMGQGRRNLDLLGN